MDREIHRACLGHHADVGRARHVADDALLHDGREIHARLDAARTGSVGDSQPPAFHEGIVLQPGVLQRALRRIQRHDGDGAHGADDLAGVFRRLLEATGRPETRLHIADRGEFGRDFDAILIPFEAIESRFGRVAERTHQSPARNDDAALQIMPPFTWMTCRVT